MAHTHNNFIHVALAAAMSSTFPTPASVGIPTPVRALFVPTPPEEGIINCDYLPELRKRKRHTPHDKTKRILKRGGFPLTPHEEEEEEEEGEEEKENPPMDGEEKE